MRSGGACRSRFGCPEETQRPKQKNVVPHNAPQVHDGVRLLVGDPDPVGELVAVADGVALPLAPSVRDDDGVLEKDAVELVLPVGDREPVRLLLGEEGGVTLGDGEGVGTGVNDALNVGETDGDGVGAALGERCSAALCGDARLSLSRTAACSAPLSLTRPLKK